MDRLKNFKIKLQISVYHLLLYFFVYFFGFYAVGSMEPIWGNLDGKVFFWLAQISLFISLGLILFAQQKVLNFKIEQKKYKIELTILDILALVLFIVILILINFRGLNYDLEGDETSYAGYTVFHFEKVLSNNNFTFLDPFKEAYILQSLLLISFVIFVISIKLASKLTWKVLINIAGLLVIFLRIINDAKFKLNTSILPYTDPTLIFNQIGTSFFGFNSIGFRITQLLIFSLFMLILYLIFTRNYDFNYAKSIFLAISIAFTPLALSMSTKIDQGKFAYFSQIIFILFLLSPKPVPSKFIASFIVLSIYFRLTNITILISLLLYFVLSRERLRKLKTHFLEEWTIYIYLLPQASINIFRIVKDFHLRPLITGYVYIPYEERLQIILKSFFTSSNTYILVFFVLSLIVFPKKQIFSRYFIFIYLAITLITYTVFTVPTALGHNRFILQIFYPILTIFLVQLFTSKLVLKKLASITLSILLFINLFTFIIYQERINKFDKFTEANEWNYNKDFSNQPKNIIWPSTAYGNYIKDNQPSSVSSVCILLGFYYESMPYVLAGNRHSSLQKINTIFSNSDYRSFREQTLTYSPGKLPYISKSIKCVIISNLYYKNDLVIYLVSNGWYIDNQEISRNGISIYVLKLL